MSRGFYVLGFFGAVLGLQCCARAFSSCKSRTYSLVVVHGLLFAVASLVAEYRLWVCRLQCLQHMGSVAVAHGLICPITCGVFPDQGSNPCPLHWQVDSKLVDHQGSPMCSAKSKIEWIK